MPPNKPLTEAELRIMDVLWDHGPSTVGGVHDRLPPSLDLAYSTVLTTMRILEEKGWLRHTKEGRAFVYHAETDRAGASRDAVREVVRKFFGNRADMLVLNLLQDEKISRAELNRLKKLIAGGQ